MTCDCGSTTASVPFGASHISSCGLAFCAPEGPALPCTIEPPLPNSCAEAETAIASTSAVGATLQAKRASANVIVMSSLIGGEGARGVPGDTPNDRPCNTNPKWSTHRLG